MKKKKDIVEIKDIVIIASEYERENFNRYPFLDGHENLDYEKLVEENNKKRKNLEDNLKKLKELKRFL